MNIFGIIKIIFIIINNICMIIIIIQVWKAKAYFVYTVNIQKSFYHLLLDTKLFIISSFLRYSDDGDNDDDVKFDFCFFFFKVANKKQVVLYQTN